MSTQFLKILLKFEFITISKIFFELFYHLYSLESIKLLILNQLRQKNKAYLIKLYLFEIQQI
jgi:hypothetical protein